MVRILAKQQVYAFSFCIMVLHFYLKRAFANIYSFLVKGKLHLVGGRVSEGVRNDGFKEVAEDMYKIAKPLKIRRGKRGKREASKL